MLPGLTCLNHVQENLANLVGRLYRASNFLVVQCHDLKEAPHMHCELSFPNVYMT